MDFSIGTVLDVAERLQVPADYPSRGPDRHAGDEKIPECLTPGRWISLFLSLTGVSKRLMIVRTRGLGL
jgi:hypothetical protein